MSDQPKYFPLATAQSALYMSLKFSLNKCVTNICAMLHFDCEMDLNFLTQAVYLAVMRSPSASVRLHKVGKQVMQYLSEEAPAQIPVLDYTGSTQQALDADLEKWSKTPFPNGSMDTQLYAPRILCKPDGFYGVYFCVSHLAFDAYALLDIATATQNYYLALRNGTPIPAAKGDYAALCAKDAEYLASPRHEEDLKFWREFFSTEPMFTVPAPNKMKPTKGKRYGVTQNPLKLKAHHVNHRLDRQLVAQVAALADEQKVPPQCCYMLAMSSFLAKVNADQKDIILQGTVSRRATLQQKQSGGTQVASVPFRVNMEHSLTAREAMQLIYQQQKQVYSHADIGAMDIVNIMKENFQVPPGSGYLTTLLTYSPYRTERHEEIPSHLSIYCNGTTYTAIYLNIMALDDSGELNCCYECMDAMVNPDTADEMHRHIVKVLQAIVQNPDTSVLELNHL